MEPLWKNDDTNQQVDWEKFSYWLKNLLKVEVVKVTFTKKDGTERIMQCTLNPALLPANTLLEAKKERKTNPDIMAVYDIENNGWRSFALTSVKTITVELG